jgi:hypothetical protein
MLVATHTHTHRGIHKFTHIHMHTHSSYNNNTASHSAGRLCTMRGELTRKDLACFTEEHGSFHSHHLHACMYVCMHICVQAQLTVFVCVCVYVCVCIYMYTYKNARVRARPFKKIIPSSQYMTRTCSHTHKKAPRKKKRGQETVPVLLVWISRSS